MTLSRSRCFDVVEEEELVLISSSWLIERPIAHRGLYDESKGIRENSLQAFAEACRQGYPVELDVQFDDEQRLIVSHEQPDAGTVVNNHAKPPTLAEVFDLIQGRVPILIEIKDRGISGRLEAAAADAVHGYAGDVALASFNPFALLHLRRMRVDRPIGQISGLLRGAKCALVRAIGRSLVSNYLTRPDFLAYELAGLPARPVARNRAKGVPVIVWGVRSPSDEVYARKYGDNVIFSGYQAQKSNTKPKLKSSEIRVNTYQTDYQKRKLQDGSVMDLSYLELIVHKNIVKLRNRYNRRALWVRHFFRWSGVLVILASVSLPLVSVLDFNAKPIVLSVLSLLIAALTGIGTFYRWDQVWRIVRKTERELTFNIVEWDLELERLKGQNETSASRDAAFAATKKLVEDTRALALNELDQYFGTVAWPNVATRGAPSGHEQPGNPVPIPPAAQPPRPVPPEQPH